LKALDTHVGGIASSAGPLIAEELTKMRFVYDDFGAMVVELNGDCGIMISASSHNYIAWRFNPEGASPLSHISGLKEWRNAVRSLCRQRT
jgi:hypothetical protein